MKISVIIPVYNVSAYLEQCVRSVQIQTYRDVEIILVDDGSTDTSGSLCDRLVTEDEHVRVVHKQNGGLSDARNVGLSYATGEYVLFLDSDDYYADCHLIANLIEKIDHWNRPDAVLFCRVDWYENMSLLVKEQPYEVELLNSIDKPIDCFDRLLKAQRFNMSACFQIIKRSVLVDNHIEFVVGLRNEDIDWSIQLWRKLQSVKVVNLYGYIYRHRANSITTTLSIQDYRSYDFMFDKWVKVLDNGRKEDRLFLQYLAYIYPTMLYGYFQLATAERRGAYAILQKHSEILRYSATRKSDRILQMKQRVGLRMCVYVFGIYGSFIKPIVRRLKR